MKETETVLETLSHSSSNKLRRLLVREKFYWI